MYSPEELESLTFRELQKIAKKRKLRQSGKGITKKVLVSILLDSVAEASNENGDCLPLQEVEVKSLHPFSSPEESSFEERNFSDVERELNDSNKENNRRRLTYEVTEAQTDSPLVQEPLAKPEGKQNDRKSSKRVRIYESPKALLSTPKPPVKIVKTPVPNRKSSGRPGALVPSKTPVIATQRTPHMIKSLTTAASSKKQLPANQPKTPSTVQKTPRLNKTVLLRVASSVKKSMAERNVSKIPKLDVKKAPNFANIHQNAFDKMDSLWDVENQRNLRKRNVQSSGAVFSFKSKSEPPKKFNSNALRGNHAQESANAVFRFGSNKEPAVASTAAINKFHAKDAACKAVNKLKPEKGAAIKEERRTFLKGVRLNRRFQMQMQNRGLL
ncbi:uncharacterized protein LOC124166976 [Ischnura elegans]|uniref:uncharacterized protein LOC124166976 n=1 Tax=Ischnura elegans TaxID=197161 RepID=UPI001ED88037|nr:uncharacterized protein LOC124166976 [Ischnura elegans]